MTLAELFSANGWDDRHEPWGLADDCEAAIEIGGEDMAVLCEDGVALWTNRERAWSEVEASKAAHVAQRIYECGNAADAASFLDWMRGWWDVAEMPLEADAAEKRVRQEIPETADMPREVLCDYLADQGHPDAELLRRHTCDIGS